MTPQQTLALIIAMVGCVNIHAGLIKENERFRFGGYIQIFMAGVMLLVQMVIK